MNHREKLRIARRMNGGKQAGAFETKQWESRRKGVQSRVDRTIQNVKKMAEARRARLTKKEL